MEGCGRPPTSREDSLVVVLGEVECGGKWKATNESFRLVGGLFGRVEGVARCPHPPTSLIFVFIVKQYRNIV